MGLSVSAVSALLNVPISAVSNGPVRRGEAIVSASKRFSIQLRREQYSTEPDSAAHEIERRPQRQERQYDRTLAVLADHAGVLPSAVMARRCPDFALNRNNQAAAY